MKLAKNTKLPTKEGDMNLLVEFGGGFCSPTHITMTPAQMQTCLEQGQEYALSLIGVSPSEYELWQSTDGTALCMERLRNGKQCGKQVGSQLDLESWKAQHRNDYCYLHSGE